MIHRGVILRFTGGWTSGLAFLYIKDSDTHMVEPVPCDNGATVRALDRAFGNVIMPDHTADGQGFKGEEIFWAKDEFEMCLGWFLPVREASDEIMEIYLNQNKRGEN